MKKKCAAIILGIAFFILGAVPAQAEDSMDAPLVGLGIIHTYNNEGNLQMSAVIGLTDGTESIMVSDEGIYAEDNSTYFMYVSDDEIYKMDYAGEYEAFPLEAWNPEEYSAYGYFSMAPAEKDEEVIVFYINTEREWETQRVTITDIYDDGEYAYLDTELDTTAIGFYPAAVVNLEKEVVAIVTNDNKMISMGDAETSGSGRILVIVVAALAAGVCVLFFVVKKKKSAKGDHPAPAPMSEEWKWSEEEASDLPGETEAFAETTAQTAPAADETVPLEESEDSGVMRYIRAVGGYMNGRIYEISQSEMLFGRDVSCAVRYAREAKNAKGISRIHCKLYWESGSLWLLDMDSTYGTYLTDYGKLQKGIPIELKKGSVFYLADKTNGFEIC